VSDLIEKEILEKRKKSRDAHSKEVMRDKISYTKTLKSIDEAEDTLKVFVTQEAEPSTARIAAMKALMDSKWKKMDRLLPVLKAIEYTGDVKGDITFRWEK